MDMVSSDISEAERSRKTRERAANQGHSFKWSGALIMIPGGEGYTIGYLSGKPDQLERIARYLRYLLSKAKSKRRVRILVPTSASVERTLRKYGCTKTGTTLVYEKQL